MSKEKQQKREDQNSANRGNSRPELKRSNPNKTREAGNSINPTRIGQEDGLRDRNNNS
ncbi:hypothetical protein OGZ37_04780 [Lactococcus lactis]|uniref:hypothetical protein n=1 Tax=Lactococcus lactis TaxID=1358 RepID=UPI0024187DF8|nr:hypothetical protein [Lactococcus lactis]MDG4965894.1 hypothetical protein [Lactococcus lactis]